MLADIPPDISWMLNTMKSYNLKILFPLYSSFFFFFPPALRVINYTTEIKFKFHDVVNWNYSKLSLPVKFYSTFL